MASLRSSGKKRKTKSTATSPPPPHDLGFRQSDLTRALRAMKSAGVLGHVEIANGEHRITVHVAKGVGMIESSSGWLSMREACVYGKLGRSRAYELINGRVLKTKKSGNRTLVSKTSIDRWLAKLPLISKKKKKR